MIFPLILREILSAVLKTPTLGLIEQKPDERDFSYDDVVLGAGSYKPKKDVHILKTLSVKSQQPFNTCCFASVTAQKEVQEGVELSVKSVVTHARKSGRLEKDGYSTLRNAQTTLIAFGATESSILDDSRTDFATYASPKNLTSAVVDNAAKHRSKRYYAVSGKDAWFHALDSGHVIQTWMDWRTGYNMSGGLRSPFVLRIGSGISVGGHAFICIGYDLKKGLMVFQNSFGRSYGDNGRFYATIHDWFNIVKSVGYVTVDMDDAPLIRSYEGKDVKAKDDPRIYRVEKGTKRLFSDERVFFKHGGRFGSDKTWVEVSSSLLQSIPDGAIMS